VFPERSARIAVEGIRELRGMQLPSIEFRAWRAVRRRGDDEVERADGGSTIDGRA